MATEGNDLELERKIVKLLLEGQSVAEIFVNNVGKISLERIKEIASLVQNENPMIKLSGPNVDAGRASILNYNVPNSTSYRMINFVMLNHDGLNGPTYDWFNDDLKNIGLAGKEKESKEGKDTKEKEGKDTKDKEKEGKDTKDTKDKEKEGKEDEKESLKDKEGRKETLKEKENDKAGESIFIQEYSADQGMVSFVSSSTKVEGDDENPIGTAFILPEERPPVGRLNKKREQASEIPDEKSDQ